MTNNNKLAVWGVISDSISDNASNTYLYSQCRFQKRIRICQVQGCGSAGRPGHSLTRVLLSADYIIREQVIKAELLQIEEYITITYLWNVVTSTSSSWSREQQVNLFVWYKSRWTFWCENRFNADLHLELDSTCFHWRRPGKVFWSD